MNEFKYKVLEIIKFKDKFDRPTCDLENEGRYMNYLILKAEI